MEFSAISKILTAQLPKTVKKDNGIYFTPPSCINTNIRLLQPYFTTTTPKILEPSCGSGEYITALNRAFPAAAITGIEYNETIYDSIRHFATTNIAIIHADYLTYSPTTKYDLIIGNPPFYVMKKDKVAKEYHPYFEGRPNIFVLFVIKSLRLLADGGILSFVLPKSALNCLYYDNMRKYVAQHFQILHIVDCKDDKYIDTEQETVILIVRKLPNGDKTHDGSCVMKIKQFTIFGVPSSIAKLAELYHGSQSLFDLGFKVSVGNVVWNQVKSMLTDDETKTRLIYSSDISDNQLAPKKYKNADKKNFINKKGTRRPMIVINRGYGVGEYSFSYCLVNSGSGSGSGSGSDIEYLVENHLICIECMAELSRDVMIDKYRQIMASFVDPRTSAFIRHYFGNSAINTTEMNHILPIYA